MLIDPDCVPLPDPGIQWSSEAVVVSLCCGLDSRFEWSERVLGGTAHFVTFEGVLVTSGETPTVFLSYVPSRGDEASSHVMLEEDQAARTLSHPSPRWLPVLWMARPRVRAAPPGLTPSSCLCS